MIEILFTADDKREARVRADRVHNRRKGSALTIKATEDFEMIGSLGEISFEKYCIWAGLDFRPHKEDTGNYGDRYDYCVKVKWKNYYMDVKSTSKYDTICLNERQYKKAIRSRCWLVGVKISYEKPTPREIKFIGARIWGYARPEDLERDERKDFEYNGVVQKMYSIPPQKIKQFKLNSCII